MRVVPIPLARLILWACHDNQWELVFHKRGKYAVSPRCPACGMTGRVTRKQVRELGALP